MMLMGGCRIVWTTLDLQGATGRNVVQLTFVNSYGVELYFKASSEYLLC